MKDSEMLDRLDIKALEALCRKLQDWLAASSHTVTQEQNRLASRIKEVGMIFARFFSLHILVCSIYFD